jgi:hypothetical protein
MLGKLDTYQVLYSPLHSAFHPSGTGGGEAMGGSGGGGPDIVILQPIYSLAVFFVGILLVG